MQKPHDNTSASQRAAREPFIKLMRELALTYQAFMALDVRLMRENGLTQPQGDVIFTLGNTPGMTFKELGECTLITKGTLTGVVDRLEAKGLVSREAAAHDGRCTIARLTPKGDEFFQRVFPEHIAAMKKCFGRLTAGQRDGAIEALRQVREVL